MAQADDLVQAVAVAIRDSYDDDPIRCNKPGVLAAGWEARAAVATTLRWLDQQGYRYLVSARADGPRRQVLSRLASAVERGGQPDGD